jgi:nicotinamidase-related amidase
MTDASIARDPYADPETKALPETGFVFRLDRAALVVVDPQNDFLSPQGVSWPFFGESITENGTVSNIEQLFVAAKSAGITVAISPHYY